MGKIKQQKRSAVHRQSGDPIGAKMALADEIESLKLAKTKTKEQTSKKNLLADKDEVNFLLL